MRHSNTIWSSGFHVLMALGLFLAGTIVLTGCDEEVGCTNRRADNYNPDAVRDDGTCINARDKFLGIYSTLHICWPDSLPDTQQPAPRYMTIAEDQLRVEEMDDVKLLDFGMNNVTVRALISKQILIIPRQDLSVQGIPMTFTGEGHLDDTGYLTIIYSMFDTNGEPVLKDCVIFCTTLD